MHLFLNDYSGSKRKKKRENSLFVLRDLVVFQGLESIPLVSQRKNEIITDLSKKIPYIMKNYTYFDVTKTHKWDFMPEE